MKTAFWLVAPLIALGLGFLACGDPEPFICPDPFVCCACVDGGVDAADAAPDGS